MPRNYRGMFKPAMRRTDERGQIKIQVQSKLPVYYSVWLRPITKGFDSWDNISPLPRIVWHCPCKNPARCPQCPCIALIFPRGFHHISTWQCCIWIPMLLSLYSLLCNPTHRYHDHCSSRFLTVPSEIRNKFLSDSFSWEKRTENVHVSALDLAAKAPLSGDGATHQ